MSFHKLRFASAVGNSPFHQRNLLLLFAWWRCCARTALARPKQSVSGQSVKIVIRGGEMSLSNMVPDEPERIRIEEVVVKVTDIPHIDGQFEIASAR